MERAETYKTNFSDFEVTIVSEPSGTLPLFETSVSDNQKEQLKIFNSLENNVPFVNAISFSNQVHFQNAYLTPIQRWFPYREGYSTRLVNAFIKELNITGNVFDPFCGSGTTLLASRQNNLNSFGIDVNPISVLVAKVENEKYSNADIENFEKEFEQLKMISKSDENFHTSFELADKVFNKDILQTLLQYKNEIKKFTNTKIQNLFFVAWLAIIEEVSNIKKEGNGIKYKNRKRTANGYINIEKDVWEKRVYPEDKFNYVKTKLERHLEIILSDIKNDFGNSDKQPNIFKGSCLEFDKLFSDQIQFTFFSPPYCNCFDYFEIHKVDLWLGEFVKNKEEFKTLRNTGFRSNTNSLNHKSILYKNEHLENLISLFNSEKLWNIKIPNVVRGYFDDTHSLLNKLYLQTTKGGYVGIVVGNSAYSGVIIPADVLISEIAKEIGFKVKNVFVTRHLTTSSQQKQELEFLKYYLRESIVLLEK
ncbi:MAG: DNA methyltransferase [Bacteroidota bacterium]|nr:DNA methyltransferase [Bacteroidota bacterium]